MSLGVRWRSTSGHTIRRLLSVWLCSVSYTVCWRWQWLAYKCEFEWSVSFGALIIMFIKSIFSSLNQLSSQSIWFMYPIRHTKRDGWIFEYCQPVTKQKPKPKSRLGFYLCGFVVAIFFDFSGEYHDLIHFEEVISGDSDDKVCPEAKSILLYRVIREYRKQDTER